MDSERVLTCRGGRKIGWIFSLGHGNYAQYLNFRECYPAEEADQAEWIGLEYETSGDWLGNLHFLPWAIRARRNQLWHLRQGLARHRRWEALFFAGYQLDFWPVFRRYPSWMYVDLPPSLMRTLAPWYEDMAGEKRAFGRVRERLQRAVMRECRGIFAMSRWAARGIRRDYALDAARVPVVLPGANLRRWRFVDRADRRGPVRILMVGSEFDRKGGPLLLDWAERTRVRNWELDIVSWPGALPGWIRHQLGNPGYSDSASASLAPRLPNVRVHCGLRANTPPLDALFEQADIFCLPTLADGSSIASLEAMATGLPVVVGAVGGIPELVEHGTTGFLMRRGDRADLAEKLEMLVEDATLRHRVGRTARESCESYYNVERQVRQILEVMTGR